MGRKKKLVNNSDIPDHTVRILAEHFYPYIREFYATEEGQREFAERKAEQAAQKPKKGKNAVK